MIISIAMDWLTFAGLFVKGARQMLEEKRLSLAYAHRNAFLYFYTILLSFRYHGARSQERRLFIIWIVCEEKRDTSISLPFHQAVVFAFLLIFAQ